jgi:hypothetical protein
MRSVLVASAALLALAGCSGASGPKTALPLKAADGSHEMIKDFIEVCSRYMVSMETAETEAKARGWSATAVPPGETQMAEMRIYDRPDRAMQINMIRTDYPHLTERTCAMLRVLPDGDAVDFNAIGKIAGVKGGLVAPPQPGKDTRGLWSLIGPDGDVITMTAITAPPTLVQMSMTTTKHVTPK